ncbi:hypothetical protein L7F22_023725 [Adiantum nelumboides]|nr:hypothetical protein [Adiantum nelumboides]
MVRGTTISGLAGYAPSLLVVSGRGLLPAPKVVLKSFQSLGLASRERKRGEAVVLDVSAGIGRGPGSCSSGFRGFSGGRKTTLSSRRLVISLLDKGGSVSRRHARRRTRSGFACASGAYTLGPRDTPSLFFSLQHGELANDAGRRAAPHKQPSSAGSGARSRSLAGDARGRGGGRGTARGNEEQPASSSSSSSSSALLADTAIRSTDNDAVGSRIAAIQHHYLDADRTRSFSRPVSAATTRPPIINIGTYLRCRAIDSLVASFVEQGTGKKQIISLGAGSDSRYWRLHAQPATRARLRHYVELDFAELTTSKVAKVVRHQELLSAVASEEADVRISPNRASLQSASYSLLACDLRTLETSESVTQSLQGVLDPTLDTLILAECVLAYLHPASSTSLLQHLAETLERPYAICYEMCVAGDASGDAAEPSKFGAVMLNNLQGSLLSWMTSRGSPSRSPTFSSLTPSSYPGTQLEHARVKSLRYPSIPRQALRKDARQGR